MTKRNQCLVGGFSVVALAVFATFLWFGESNNPVTQNSYLPTNSQDHGTAAGIGVENTRPKDSLNFRTTAHGLSRNVGPDHGEAWRATPKHPISRGALQEYGETLDVMPGGSTSGQFTAAYKNRPKWLTPPQAVDTKVSGSGRYTIQPFNQSPSVGFPGATRIFNFRSKDFDHVMAELQPSVTALSSDKSDAVGVTVQRRAAGNQWAYTNLRQQGGSDFNIMLGTEFSVEVPIRITTIGISGLLNGNANNIGLWKVGASAPLATFSAITDDTISEVNVPADVTLSPGIYRLAGSFKRYRYTPATEIQVAPDITLRGGVYVIGAALAYPNSLVPPHIYGYVNFKYETVVANATPTLEIAASANPAPVSGATTNLSVLGADDGAEANLIYTWSTLGTPPAPVSFSANDSNAAKNTVATFTTAGSYSFQVTIKDADDLAVSSSVAVTVQAVANESKWAYTNLRKQSGWNANYTLGTEFSVRVPIRITTIEISGLLNGNANNIGLWKVGGTAPLATFSATTGEAIAEVRVPTDVTLSPGTYRLAGSFKRFCYTPVSEIQVAPEITLRGGVYESGAALAYPQTFYATNTWGHVNFKFDTVAANAAPTVAVVASANPDPVNGATTNLSVLGADDGGETNLIYTWASLGTPPATVSFSANDSNAAKNTIATFNKAGSYSFQVTIRDAGNLEVNSSVTVAVNATLASIAVTPTSAIVTAGGTQAFAANAKNQFGNTLASQPTFVWTVTGSGTINGTGIFTAGSVAGGPHTVTASSSGKSGAVDVTIMASNQPPQIVSFPWANPNPVILTSTTVNVVASDPDGGPQALTYRWSTVTGPATVRFAPNSSTASDVSTATFTAPGTYTLRVIVSDGASSATETVGMEVLQTLASITVNPTNSNVADGGTQWFTAVGKDQFETTLAAQPAFAWAVTGGGTINAAGQFTAGSIAGGPHTVIAMSGNRSGTASVEVHLVEANIIGPDEGDVFLKGEEIKFSAPNTLASIGATYAWSVLEGTCDPASGTTENFQTVLKSEGTIRVRLAVTLGGTTRTQERTIYAVRPEVVKIHWKNDHDLRTSATNNNRILDPVWIKTLGGAVTKNEPGAYTQSGIAMAELEIEASTQLSSATSVQVQGVGATANDESFTPQGVTFHQWTWSSGELELYSSPLHASVNLYDTLKVKWQYRVQNLAGGWSAWVDMNQSAQRLYTVMAKPISPESIPRADILDYACRWAATATTPEDLCSGLLSNGFRDHYTWVYDCHRLSSDLVRLVASVGVPATQHRWSSKTIYGSAGTMGYQQSKLFTPVGQVEGTYHWEWHQWAEVAGSQIDPTAATSSPGTWGAYEDDMFTHYWKNGEFLGDLTLVANQPGQRFGVEIYPENCTYKTPSVSTWRGPDR